MELREAGIDAPILVLSEPPADETDDVVAHDLTPIVYTPAGRRAGEGGRGRRRGASRCRCTSRSTPACTGSAPRPTRRVALARADRTTRPSSSSRGVHPPAVADEPDDPYTAEQLAAVRRGARRARGGRPRARRCVHAANSAGARSTRPARATTWCAAASRSTASRPAPALADVVDLRPALSLKARVSHVKRLDAGERRLVRPALPARPRRRTSPRCRSGTPTACPGNLGVAAARCSSAVAAGRSRARSRWTSSWSTSATTPVEVGDEVVLIGRQGDDEITARDWAERLGTIAYEIVCGIGPRVPASTTVERPDGRELGATAAARRRRRRRRARGRRPAPACAPAPRCAEASAPPDRDADAARRRSLLRTTTCVRHVDGGDDLRRRARARRPTDRAPRTASRFVRGLGQPARSPGRAASACIAFDHRGHGESTPGDAGHSLEHLAARPPHGARAPRPPRRVLVGHSMGGMAIMQLLRRPSRRARASGSPGSCSCPRGRAAR